MENTGLEVVRRIAITDLILSGDTRCRVLAGRRVRRRWRLRMSFEDLNGRQLAAHNDLELAKLPLTLLLSDLQVVDNARDAGGFARQRDGAFTFGDRADGAR